MKKTILLLTMSLSLYGIAQQVGVNTTSPKAMLEVEYKADLPVTMNQTIGLPRVTTEQRNNFENLQAGQMVWNTDKKCIDYYDGTVWQCTDGTRKDIQIPGIVEGTDKCLKLVADKFYGDGKHDFIYCEIEVKGIYDVNGQPYKKKWLNLNLGAEVAKVGSPNFNPTISEHGAEAHQNENLYGSLYQWQRPTDGHEFRNSKTTTTYATNWEATQPIDVIGKFISDHSSWIWTQGMSGLIEGLWKKGGGNNPCPHGYHVPSTSEWMDFYASITENSEQIQDSDILWVQTKLPNLATGGFRNNDVAATVIGIGESASYWSSDIDEGGHGEGITFTNNRIHAGGSLLFPGEGASVRCIKD